jgi:HSP20 family molecular chaperone IbpA
MYSYDQVLTDVTQLYEQLTGSPAPKIDVKNPRFPLPQGVDPVGLVQSEINFLNRYLINTGISQRLSKMPTWTPRAEVYETPEEFVIRLELAGLTSEDVTLSPVNNNLVVRGIRRFRRPSEDAQYLNSELIYGSFERFIPLPHYVSVSDLEKSFENGVMELRMRKAGATAASRGPGEQRTKDKAATHEKETGKKAAG